jgi:peptidyl-prolyl cis-trans isomerase SurA
MVNMHFSTLRVARRLTLVLLTWSVFNLCASAQTSSASPANSRDFIVAVVDALPITNHDVRLRAAQMRTQLTQQGRVIPSASALMREALERLINEKALLQFAKETGADTEISEANSGNNLSTSAAAVDNQEQREQMILQRLTERHVPGRIKVSDAEIDLGIRDRQATQTNVADVELAHILIAVPENANASEVAALQSKANSVLARLKAGAGFAEVAKEMSDSVERDKGGLMGVRPFDRYPSLFVEATQALRVGDLSAVISSGAGFHILKLVSKRNNNVMTVTETRVRHILLRPSSQLSQAAARAQLAEYRRLVDSGRADFAKLAVDHSQDASASNGGDLGWVGPGMFVPEFEQAMRQLAIGQISDPTVSRFGVHLIQVLARRDAALSEREMRDIVRNSLRDKKFDETYQLWVQEVRGRAYVEYRDPPL